MSKKYVILETTEIGDIDFSAVFETSAESLGRSLDGSLTFVKYEGAKPRFLYGKDTLTHSEMVEVLNTPAWLNTPDPPDED